MDHETRDDGKTVIRNSCGHDFAYRIKRPSAVKWLEGRPCPSCVGKKGGRPRKEQPQPQPMPEPQPQPQGEGEGETQRDQRDHGKPKADPARVAEILATMPTVPDVPHHAVLPELMLLVRADLPVWLQGPPGTSKSTLAHQTADALGLGFYPVACHEMMTRTDLFGYRDAAGAEHRTPLWDAYETGGLLLLDEIDNGNPNLLAALNSALSNGHAVFGSGTLVTRHEDFRVVATANTAGLGPEHGYLGRNGVDLATRDRFVTVAVPIDDVLESALPAIASGDAEAIAAAAATCRKRSDKRLKRAAETLAIGTDQSAILAAVRILRAEVDARFRGSVVSPRTTLHAAMMTGAGFTLADALTAKLVGLDAEDVTALVRKALA